MPGRGPRGPRLLPLFASNSAPAHGGIAVVWRWLTGPWRPAAPAEVVLYTRSGCHLCDDARAVLERAGRSHPLAVRSVDVDSNPDLAARFGTEVPVVEIDGRVRFRGRVNAVLLERILAKRR